MPELYISWLELGKMDLEEQAAQGRDGEGRQVPGVRSSNFPACLALRLNAARGPGDKPDREVHESAYKVANPTDPTIAYNEAVEYLNKGDDAKAKPLLEEALQGRSQVRGRPLPARHGLLPVGETAKAKETLQKFLEVAPSTRKHPPRRRC